MVEMPEIQNILKQFPWARIEKDGSFSFEITLAMHFLLGSGSNFGWWARKSLTSVTREINYDSIRFSSSHFQLGRYLTLRQHFDEESGWNLQKTRYHGSRLFMVASTVVSSNVRAQLDELLRVAKVTAQVTCGSTSSLAAQRLSLVTPVGFFIPDGDGSKRRKLNIHCLGVEVSSLILSEPLD